MDAAMIFDQRKPFKEKQTNIKGAEEYPRYRNSDADVFMKHRPWCYINCFKNNQFPVRKPQLINVQYSKDPSSSQHKHRSIDRS